MPKPIESSLKPMRIGVLDAQTLDQFLANAKEAWLKAHPQERKRRGRPSEMERVFEIIWGAEQKGLLGKAPTQGKVIRLVREQLGDKALTKEAIRKYAKMWLLLYRKPCAEWSEEEMKFLEKKALIIKYQRLILETMLRYGQRTGKLSPDRKGVEFRLEAHHLEGLSGHLKSLCHEIARFNPPKGAEGYPDHPELSLLLDVLQGHH